MECGVSTPLSFVGEVDDGRAEKESGDESPHSKGANASAKMTHRPFTFTGRIRSFKYAIRGIATMLASQHNAWIHALATVLVCGTGLWLGLSSAQWCWIVLAIVAVWTAEALNTAFEFLADAASPEFHPLVEKSKDVAAGAVLISAVGAAVIALLILGPPLLAKIGWTY